MPNEFLSCFSELLDAQAESMGSRPTASIGGVTADVILEDPDTAQSLMAGSYSDDGGTWIQCLASPFANRPIKFQTPVIMGEQKLQVINVPISNHGVYRFQIGDPTRR